MSNLKGGCLCGAIRYSAAEPILGQAVCHCKNCQKQSGSAFSVVVLVNRSSFQVDPVPAVFEETADSGAKVNRFFLSSVRLSALYSVVGKADVVIIKAGSLDDPTWLAPRAHVWCSSAWPWTVFPEKAIKIAKNAG